MGKVKQEHIVPQCYLNMFTDDGKLNVYDKSKGEVRKNQAVCKIAKQKAFYDFSEEELVIIKEIYPSVDDVQYIEKLFSNDIEVGLKKCLDAIRMDKILQTEGVLAQLDDEFKMCLSVQMAYQFLRTKGLRGKLPEVPNTSVDFLQKLMLIDDNIIAQWAYYFNCFHWSVTVNKTAIPYYTSDNPVCIYNAVTNKLGLDALNGHGFVIICYPYSPTVSVSLALLEEDVILPSLVLEHKTEEQVKFLNALQYKNADNNVFTKADMYDIKKIIDSSNSFTKIKLSEQDSVKMDKIAQEVIQGLKDGYMDADRNSAIQMYILNMIKKLGM
ncbi:MAG: DUF4238 domain-containing protein [Lachnospiraceae bacterium]|nr:DUF4238 domain-containing protein [Lachnospiraceae bacterium]